MEKAVVELAEEEANELARQCLELNVDPERMVSTISKALKVVGEKYEQGEYFLPELVTAGAMMSSIIELVKPLLTAKGVKARGKVVIGTVKNDIHDLGKTIVAALLISAGFEVLDLGTDVDPNRFLAAAENEKPEIVAMSALLSTTRVEMKNVIDALERSGLRRKVKIMVGGGAVTQEFASKIGADAYGKDAIEAVRISTRLAGDKAKEK